MQYLINGQVSCTYICEGEDAECAMFTDENSCTNTAETISCSWVEECTTPAMDACESREDGAIILPNSGGAQSSTECGGCQFQIQTSEFPGVKGFIYNSDCSLVYPDQFELWQELGGPPTDPPVYKCAKPVPTYDTQAFHNCMAFKTIEYGFS